MSQKEKTPKHHCMFCGRSEGEVPFLLQGIEGFICSDCVQLAHDYLKDTIEPQAVAGAPEKLENLKTPAEIKSCPITYWSRNCFISTGVGRLSMLSDLSAGFLCCGVAVTI